MRLCATVTLFFPVSTWANDAKRGCLSATLKKFVRYKVDKNTSEKKTQIEQWNMLNLIARACTQRVHARANVYKKNYNLPSKVSPVGEEFHHNWKFVNWFLFHCFFFLSSSLVSLFSCMFCWLKYCNIYIYICIDSMYERARASSTYYRIAGVPPSLCLCRLSAVVIIFFASKMTSTKQH